MASSVIIPENITAKASELLEIVGLPSEGQQATKQLSGSASDLVRVVVSIVDGMVLRTMEERTAEGFAKTRIEVFPGYFAAMSALGALIRVTVPRKDIHWLIEQSLSELEAEFRNSGAAKFGSELCDRGIFTVWTLRKIHDLAEEIEKTGAGNSERSENALKFATHGIWARFHIDCLVKSMRSGRPIFPDVVESIADGLRAAVNAYAWLRQEVDQLKGIVEPELPPVEWDQEDQNFLADSMRDITREAF